MPSATARPADRRRRGAASRRRRPALPAAAPAGWHAAPVEPPPREPRGNGRATTFVGIVLILFGALALVDAFLPAWADDGRFLWPAFIVGIGALLVADRRATRADRARDRRRSPHRRTAPHPDRAGVGPDPRRSDVRFVGDPAAPSPTDAARARSVSPGGRATRSGRSSSRRSTRPRGTRTRRSGSGFFVGVFAFAAPRLARVGRVRHARRRHRRRVHRDRRSRGRGSSPGSSAGASRSGADERLLAHPYRPLRGGVVAILRAEFADENRWRDVLYVGGQLPARDHRVRRRRWPCGRSPCGS